MYNFHTCNSELILAKINEEISDIDKQLRFGHDQALAEQQQELFDAREWTETYMAPSRKAQVSTIKFNEKNYQVWRSLRTR
jgi:hypothetical protein